MIVRTTAGRVEGCVVDGVHRFLGVPYADPPVGDRRLLAPAPVTAWEGERPATAYGHTAFQPDEEFTLIPEPKNPGDDFLNLNVYTPDPGAAGMQVTIGGQSAGAAACVTLMTTPAARGLFRNVIAMSGSAANVAPLTSARVPATTQRLAAELGVAATRDGFAKFDQARMVRYLGCMGLDADGARVETHALAASDLAFSLSG
mgnify:CR=1 FL=1